jgi:glyoxalase family protein
MELNGLHHVTAVTGDPKRNVIFYTDILGLRLVKKTVNQDDVSAYHLFYGDELGNPGTELTFFDWPRLGPNRNGPGSIANTALRVPGKKALAWWAQRLTDHGIEHSGLTEFNGHALINFTDPEGQHLSLVDDKGQPGGIPWVRSPVPPEYAVRGLFSVTLIVSDLKPTEFVLTKIMGYQKTAEYPNTPDVGECTVAFSAGEGGAGKEIYVIEQPEKSRAILGRGGVHHVAFRVADEDEQRQWRAHLTASGLGVSDFIDRFYFRSIYFPIPGNILFEIATDGPGFATDEEAEHLGEALALPPFLEPYRAQIEANLRPLD